MRQIRLSLNRTLGLALFLVPLLLDAAPRPALGAESLAIVVIDTQKIYREAAAAKGLQKKIDSQRSTYQDELRKKEEALRGADKELARQRTILSSEAFAQKRRELEEQVANLQRDIQSRRKVLEKQFTQGMKQIRSVLVEISQEIARERDAALVIEKSAVVLVKPDLEITQEALKRLNRKLPKISVAAPQN
jgi:Skp family chaperone for outer membrane proteins